MKFSHKLFKIQAKMSLPVFILMGSVCHLGASDDEFSSRDDGRKSMWRERTNVRLANDSSEDEDARAKEKLTSPLKDDRRNSLSSNDSPAVKSIRKVVSISVNAQQRAEDFSKPKVVEEAKGGFEQALKGSPKRSEMFNGSDGRSLKKKPALSQEEQLKAATLFGVAGRNGRTTLSHSSSGQAEVSQDQDVHGSPLHSIFDVYNVSSPQCASYKELEGAKKVLTYGAHKQSTEVIEEVDSPSVIAQKKRDAAMRASTDSDIVPHGERIDFDEEAHALVVQDDNALTLFDPHSIFAASLEDQVTLCVGGTEVVTTIGAVLTKNDTSEASSVLKYHVHYAEYKARDEKKRKKYLNNLLVLPGYSEHKLNIDTVLPFLIDRVLSSSSFLPSFFKSSVQKVNHSAALIQRSMGEAQGIFARVSLMSQQNSMLRNQNLALVQSLRQAFNSSELSEIFASDSTAVIRFDTNDWSPEQFSACLQLIVNQLLESQKSNTALSRAQEKLSTAHEKIAASNEELSGTVRDLSKAGLSASATIERLTAEQKDWHEKELDFVQQIAKLNSDLTDTQERLNYHEGNSELLAEQFKVDLNAAKEAFQQEKQDAIQQAVTAARAAWEQEKQDAIQKAVMAERGVQTSAKANLQRQVDQLTVFKTNLQRNLIQHLGKHAAEQFLQKFPIV